MTVEIRQLVIKSQLDDGARDRTESPVTRPAPCGDIGPEAGAASREARRLRAQLTTELDRLRER